MHLLVNFFFSAGANFCLRTCCGGENECDIGDDSETSIFGANSGCEFCYFACCCYFPMAAVLCPIAISTSPVSCILCTPISLCHFCKICSYKSKYAFHVWILNGEEEKVLTHLRNHPDAVNLNVPLAEFRYSTDFWDEIQSREWSGNTPLHLATAHPALVRALLEKGADIRRKNVYLQETALIRAVRQSHLKSCLVLIANTNAVDDTDKDGKTALLHLFNSNLAYSPVVSVFNALLAKGADVNHADSKGNTALLLLFAVTNCSDEMFNEGILDELLAKGANVNASLPATLRTPLHLACRAFIATSPNRRPLPPTQVVESAKARGVCVKLVQYGADLGLIDSNKHSPLFGLPPDLADELSSIAASRPGLK